VLGASKHGEAFAYALFEQGRPDPLDFDRRAIELAEPNMQLDGSLDRWTKVRVNSSALGYPLQTLNVVLLGGGHFDVYGKDFAEASSAARDWFVEHLTRM